MNEKSTHTRFPVVDDNNRVVGMITSKDIISKPSNVFINKVMSKNPEMVQTKTSLASEARMMVWEGIEVVPVVDQSSHLKGVISRQDVLKALQQLQRQPQMGETIDDIVAQNLSETEEDKAVYETKVTPQMTNHLGTLSNGVFTALITEASNRLLRNEKKGDLVAENLTVYFIKPVQIDSEIKIKPVLLEVGRLYAKLDVEVYQGDSTVGKALIMAQLIDR